jgi:hypothetical protein
MLYIFGLPIVRDLLIFLFIKIFDFTFRPMIFFYPNFEFSTISQYIFDESLSTIILFLKSDHGPICTIF